MVELREELESRGLRVLGRKAELVERLLLADAPTHADGATEAPAPAETPTRTTRSRRAA